MCEECLPMFRRHIYMVQELFESCYSKLLFPELSHIEDDQIKTTQ